MLAPVSNVTNASAVQPINVGTPVATDDTARLQLQRQLQDYNDQLAAANDQLAAAQEAARQAATAQETARRVQQLQEQIATTQAQLDQNNTDNNLQNIQTQNAQIANVQQAQQQANNLATTQAAAQQAAANQNAIAPEPQIRPPVTNATDITGTNTGTNGLQTAQNTEPTTEVIPPLAPNNSGRLVNTQV